MDFLRHKKHSPRSLEESRPLADPRAPSPEEGLEKSELRAMVQKEIDQLPGKLRFPILLYQFEELSYKEIAKILGASEKAVERRIHRAKEMLRERLKMMGVLPLPNV